jgi:endonuclease-3
MHDDQIHAAIAILRETMPAYPQPLIAAMAEAERTPFRILIATILSLRTKDTLTAVVAPRLFALADTPAAMLALDEEHRWASTAPRRAASARYARC